MLIFGCQLLEHSKFIFVLGKSIQAKPEFDEFGRDKSAYIEQAKQRRAVEREARRNRRKKERETAMSKDEDSKQYHEGLSSDDEEGSGEVLRFKNDRGMQQCVVNVGYMKILCYLNNQI